MGFWFVYVAYLSHFLYLFQIVGCKRVYHLPSPLYTCSNGKKNVIKQAFPPPKAKSDFHTNVLMTTSKSNSSWSGTSRRKNREISRYSCGDVCPIYVSCTPENPGRKFHGYLNYQVNVKYCSLDYRPFFM